jgi:tetratricopeptide (TPR) repeat protein
MPGRPLQFSAVHEYLLRARQLLSRGALDEAETLAREVLQEPEAHHILGLIAHRRDDLAAAETALRQAIARDGRVAAYHHALGNVLQDRGKLKDAIAAYRRALRLQPALAAAWNDLGTARYAQEEFEAAVECYQQAVRLRPGHAVAHANLGAVYRKLGLLSEARRALQRELWLRLKGFFTPKRRDEAREQLDSGNAPLAAALAEKAGDHSVLCAARLQQGRVDEALAAARKANDPLALARILVGAGRIDEAVSTLGGLRVPAEARNAPLHLALGDFQHRKKTYDAAEAAYRRALELDPQLLAAHVRLSDVLRDTGRLDEAQAAAERAIALDEESPLGEFAAAMVQRARGRMEAAIEAFERAKKLDPQRVQTLQQLALALRESDRMEDAVRELRAAVRLRPDDPGLLSDLGMVLADVMQYDEAMACYRRALERAPESAGVIQRQAHLIDHLGDRAQGEALLQKAVALAPDDDHVRYNVGLQRLKYHDFAAGWDGYEYRRNFDSFIGKYRHIPLPEWDGAPLDDRTVLVLPEQGLGDEIMFGSCVPEVLSRARHVYLECDAKLEAIFRRSFPGCHVISRQRTLANDWVTRLEPRPELQIHAGSLARRFRRSLADFPDQPFLKPDPDRVSAWRTKLATLGPGRKIGLSWRGGVGYTGRTRRSIPLEQLLPVLRLPGVQFVNLQYTDVREEMKNLAARHGVTVHHWQEAIDDYDQTAALVGALDGVLTVCTAIVHLTGGLGKPGLVMVPYGADWRYGGEGERMPWYPSVRLVRQSRVGDWSDVLAEVGRRLSTYS